MKRRMCFYMRDIDNTAVCHSRVVGHPVPFSGFRVKPGRTEKEIKMNRLKKHINQLKLILSGIVSDVNQYCEDMHIF